MIRTANGVVPTTPEPTVSVTWRCACHDQQVTHYFPQSESRDARQFARELKRNDNVQPLTVHVSD